MRKGFNLNKVEKKIVLIKLIWITCIRLKGLSKIEPANY